MAAVAASFVCGERERDGGSLRAFMAAPNDDFFVAAATEAESFSAAANVAVAGPGLAARQSGWERISPPSPTMLS